MQVKDVTTTSFGLLIAYLVPGLVGLYAARFWLDGVDSLFTTLGTKDATFGLFLLVILAGLAIGMVVTPIKALVYESSRPKALSSNAVSALNKPDKHEAFRTVIDEQYRYHQCWGNLSLVLIPFFVGWFRVEWSALSDLGAVAGIALAGFVELVVIAAAWESFTRYIDRAEAVAA